MAKSVVIIHVSPKRSLRPLTQSELLNCIDEARIPALDEVFQQLGGEGWLISYKGTGMLSPPSAFFTFEIQDWSTHTLYGITKTLQETFGKHWENAVSRFA